MLRRVSETLLVILVAAALHAEASAQTIYKVVIPTAGGTDHPTALTRAAENLVSDLNAHQAAIGGPWALNSVGSGYSLTPLDLVVVWIVPSYAPPSPHAPIGDTGFFIKVGARLNVYAQNRVAAVDGVHRVRLELEMSGYSLGAIPSGGLRVKPAFERRGFMVLSNDESWRAREWEEYIDYHQLLGANTLTVGLPGYWDPCDPNGKSYAPLQAAAKHCNEVGVKFQVNVAANMIDSTFYYDHFEPEHSYVTADATNLYDKDFIAAANAIGVEGDDGLHTTTPGGATPHSPAHGFGASLARVEEEGLTAELQAIHDKIYMAFSGIDPCTEQPDASLGVADAFVVVSTEGAADYGPSIVADPVGTKITRNFGWVTDRISTGAKAVNWGWLWDDWNRWGLDDPTLALHTEFVSQGYSQPYSAMAAEIGSNGEWIQEVRRQQTWGLLAILDYVWGAPGIGLLAAGVNPYDPGPDLAQLIDPLGKVALETDFDVTAFLYWCHKENHIRNYFPRPALRETIRDLRLALRKHVASDYCFDIDLDDDSITDGEDESLAATGVMGYRFGQPNRRPLNDFVVLRFASDEKFAIDADDTGAEARELLLTDMANFLTEGDATYAGDVKEALDALDLSRPLWKLLDPDATPSDPDFGELDFPLAPGPVDLDKLEDCLAEFSDNDIPWWDMPGLVDLYPMLAFTLLTETAADLAKQPTPNLAGIDKLVQEAIRQARQTSALADYWNGGPGIHGLIEGLKSDG